MNPLTFPLQCREDLLPWADIWADWGFPLHCLAAQVLFKEKRWPGSHKRGCFWTVLYGIGGELSTHRNRLRPDLYAMRTSATTNQKRVYVTRVLAFTDVVNHMASCFDQSSLEKRLQS